MILTQYYLGCLAHASYLGASGYRSSIAASILERHGVPEVADLVGGIRAWTASSLPTVDSDYAAVFETHR